MVKYNKLHLSGTTVMLQNTKDPCAICTPTNLQYQSIIIPVLGSHDTVIEHVYFNNYWFNLTISVPLQSFTVKNINSNIRILARHPINNLVIENASDLDALSEVLPHVRHLDLSNVHNNDIDLAVLKAYTNIKEITLQYQFDNASINELPWLEKITFNEYGVFNQPLNTFPSIRHVRFNESYNHSINGLCNATTIKFPEFSVYNQPITTDFPNITHATFGVKFNQSVSALCKVKSLTFENKCAAPKCKCCTNVKGGLSEFNQPFTVEFNNITHVKFGYAYNQPITALQNATSIEFSKESQFNQHITGSFPNLKNVRVGIAFNSYVDPKLKHTLSYYNNDNVQKENGCIVV